MPDKLRVGVIGTSWWPSLVHLPSLASHPGVQVAALCGRDQSRAQGLAATYEVPQVFADYREMIAQANLDALVVGAPDDLHYPMTMAALDAGLHVLCEKPLALTAQQAGAVWHRAKTKGLKHMTFFTFRWLPVYRYLHRLLAHGEIGRPYHCQITYVSGHGRYGGYDWRFDPSRSNGIVSDLGSHCIDLARWLIGDISAVSAQLGSFVDRSGEDGRDTGAANDSASLAFQFANGAQGLIYVTAAAHLGERLQAQQVVIYGERGTLESTFSLTGGGTLRMARSDQMSFETLTLPEDLWRGGGTSQPPFLEAVQLFQRQSIGDRAFVDAILQDRPISPSFYDGLKAQQVVDAALVSAREGRRLAIEEIK